MGILAALWGHFLPSAVLIEDQFSLSHFRSFIILSYKDFFPTVFSVWGTQLLRATACSEQSWVQSKGVLSLCSF